jgi:hypothetical protein
MIWMKLDMHEWYKTNNLHLNMTYKVPLPFTKYARCTCEWAFCENLCKHQVAILLTCTNLTKKYIIQYCGTWYGYDHGGFATMFADPTYLHIYDNEYDDETMKITMNNHGLLICVSLWDQMILPLMWKKKRTTTNVQVHPPPQRKCLLEWVT